MNFSPQPLCQMYSMQENYNWETFTLIKTSILGFLVYTRICLRTYLFCYVEPDPSISFVFAEKTLDHFLPGAIIGRPDQIFAFQDREHLPFLCLHQPAKQIFFRTSRLQSEIFAPIQRKSLLAPPKMFAIS